jgi:hypothetical protein
MKRIALVAAVLGAMIVALAGSAFAGNGYSSQPGFEEATANTVCAGHGAFGAFGTTGNGTHDFGINNTTNSNGAAPGVDDTQVGLNNSQLCGKR